MNTVNIVLMVILSAIIGFALGNVWGQAKAKALFSQVLESLTKNIKAVTKGETDSK